MFLLSAFEVELFEIELFEIEFKIPCPRRDVQGNDGCSTPQLARLLELLLMVH